MKATMPAGCDLRPAAGRLHPQHRCPIYANGNSSCLVYIVVQFRNAWLSVRFGKKVRSADDVLFRIEHPGGPRLDNLDCHTEQR